MIEYILLSIVKILDNIILTAKSLATYKEQRILSSVLVIISQLIFYLVIGEVINDNTMLAIIVVSVSSGVGNYIALVLNERLKKDIKWCMIFTSSDVDKSKRFSEYLKENNIKNIILKGYNRSWSDVISIIIFSKNKAESRLIMQYLKESDFFFYWSNWLIYISIYLFISIYLSSGPLTFFSVICILLLNLSNKFVLIIFQF